MSDKSPQTCHPPPILERRCIPLRPTPTPISSACQILYASTPYLRYFTPSSSVLHRRVRRPCHPGVSSGFARLGIEDAPTSASRLCFLAFRSNCHGSKAAGSPFTLLPCPKLPYTHTMSLLSPFAFDQNSRRRRFALP